MEPQVVLLTDVSDLIDGVKSTVHCRTSGGVHKQRHITLQDQQARRLDGKRVERARAKTERVTLTFCLASMILASRSEGMTLPLKEHAASHYSSNFPHSLCYPPLPPMSSPPLICVQQDHVLGTKPQSSSSLLYGVVAL